MNRPFKMDLFACISRNILAGFSERGYACPMWDKKPDRRSPIKDPPLRQAGQGLDEQISLERDEIGDLIVIPFVFIVFAIHEWWRHFYPLAPHPKLITLFALLACAYSVKKIIAARQNIRNLRRGKEGEVSVGQELEFLREKGIKVLHDVQGEGFNVDHILIGPKGIFTIETKTWSKSAQSPTSIGYDGNVITLGNHPMVSDPVKQAKAQASWLKDLIKKQTGKPFPVRPVVVFPGWYVNKQPYGAEVWVLNPKALPGFLKNQTVSLTKDDVEFVYARLADYVRTSDRPAN